MGEASLGLAPILDVVLLLLIFFLVTTSFTTRHLPVEVPRAEGATAPGPAAAVVEIDRVGRIFVEGRPETLDGLERYAAERGPVARIELRADREVAHGRVVAVLDRLQRGGISSVGIAVDELGDPDPKR